ncbi:hypothetical protein ACFPAF_10645 [Hymenobacter endophyticus]|uniref:Lipoprotein n=1 Tax=Hymenobacter endophyticus TaxID=3076335 RepID=A0ABU3THM7_9BACT|nr:hypothetical protein [Hymenobacter endophyticus]MDU0370853.1 hypothetical protein [Hymenobacter endophyticus]
MKKRPTVPASLLLLLLSGFLAVTACQKKAKPTEQTQVLPQRPTESVSSAESVASPATTYPMAADPVEAVVTAIRQEFARINAAPLDSLTKPFRCDTDGTVTFYSAQGRVVKVVIDWGFLGDGTTTSEYYYQNNKLIFFYETYTGGPAGLPETTNDERIYVRNDKAIRFLKNHREAPCSPCTFARTSRPYRILNTFNGGDVEAALCQQ